MIGPDILLKETGALAPIPEPAGVFVKQRRRKQRMPNDLDQTSLHALLEALGTDDTAPGLAYQNLRLRLIRFFRWNNCRSPEDLADTALDRLAGKLAGAEETILDVHKFAAGIARMLLHEYRAHQAREQSMLSHLSWTIANRPSLDPAQQDHEDALSHCLGTLSPENRQMLERYYTGDAGRRIQNRALLAQELGIGINALRNRALRLRQQLEDCTAGYLGRSFRRDEHRMNVTHKERKNL